MFKISVCKAIKRMSYEVNKKIGSKAKGARKA